MMMMVVVNERKLCTNARHEPWFTSSKLHCASVCITHCAILDLLKGYSDGFPHWKICINHWYLKWFISQVKEVAESKKEISNYQSVAAH